MDWPCPNYSSLENTKQQKNATSLQVSPKYSYFQNDIKPYQAADRYFRVKIQNQRINSN